MSPRHYIEVFVDNEFEPAVKSAMRHLCLETDDIFQAEKHFQAAGIETTPIKRGCDNTYQFWFKDPNGIDIELHQYTSLSSQFTGKDCEVDW